MDRYLITDICNREDSGQPAHLHGLIKVSPFHIYHLMILVKKAKTDDFVYVDLNIHMIYVSRCRATDTFSARLYECI